MIFPSKEQEGRCILFLSKLLKSITPLRWIDGSLYLHNLLYLKLIS